MSIYADRTDTLDETLIHIERAGRVLGVMVQLPCKHERILRLRYGIGCRGHTLKEVGDMLGITAAGVRGHEQRGLRKLRRILVDARGREKC